MPNFELVNFVAMCYTNVHVDGTADHDPSVNIRNNLSVLQW